MDFEPIPSLMYRYEINPAGVVRNMSGRVMKNFDGTVHVRRKGKCISRSVNRLLKEVFGVETDEKRYKAVTIRKGAEVHRFSTMKACAIFLSPLVFYDEESIRHFLSWRRKRIGLWVIEYC